MEVGEVSKRARMPSGEEKAGEDFARLAKQLKRKPLNRDYFVFAQPQGRKDLPPNGWNSELGGTQAVADFGYGTAFLEFRVDGVLCAGGCVSAAGCAKVVQP